MLEKWISHRKINLACNLFVLVYVPPIEVVFTFQTSRDNQFIRAWRVAMQENNSTYQLLTYCYIVPTIVIDKRH